MPLRRKKLDTTSPLKGFSEASLMGKRMIGGEWTNAEVFHKAKLVNFMVEMANSGDSAKFYYKNLARIRAIIPPKDRVNLLSGIASQKGVTFKIGEKPTEEELMHRIFNTPLPTKYKQQELGL